MTGPRRFTQCQANVPLRVPETSHGQKCGPCIPSSFARYNGNRARREGLDGKPEREQQREVARTSHPLPPQPGESPAKRHTPKPQGRCLRRKRCNAGASATPSGLRPLPGPDPSRQARGLIRATGRIRGDGGSAQARDSEPTRISRDLEREGPESWARVD